MILVTHDLGVVAGMADEVAVMYAGRIVERGPARRVLREPRHPYTHGLLASVPRLDRSIDLTPIPGLPPDLSRLGPGCPFAPRCEHAHARCDAYPEWVGAPDDGAACWLDPEALVASTGEAS